MQVVYEPRLLLINALHSNNSRLVGYTEVSVPVPRNFCSSPSLNIEDCFLVVV